MAAIVAFCGFQGAGKDAAAQALLDTDAFGKVSFAGALKDALAAIFGWDRARLEGLTPEDRAWREQVDPFWAAELGRPEFTPRWAMQHVGTDVLRTHFHSDLWVIAAKRHILAMLAAERSVVITDCRFPNEFRMVRALGGRVVQIQRGALPDWVARFRAGEQPRELVRLHASDYAWTLETPDAIIHNDGSLEDLAAAVMDEVYNSQQLSCG